MAEIRVGDTVTVLRRGYPPYRAVVEEIEGIYHTVRPLPDQEGIPETPRKLWRRALVPD